MASTSHTPISSIASSATPTLWDVFLSFRGIDTRYTFTDHLYTALNRNGIRTFMDDPELRSGEVIEDALLQAIQESKTYVVVLSKNYASSGWCLDELVEIQAMGRLVVPVFYNIEPSAVRRQTGSFNEALQKHETRFGSNITDKWRVTLTNVGNLSGYHVCENTSQADIINKVVKRVLLEINPKTLDVAKHLVGLDSRVEGITPLLSTDKEGVNRIGIHGMAGIGKTTLAKEVYNQNYRRFQGSCFLANVREASGTDKGLVCLQQKLINDVLKREDNNIDNVDQGIEMIRARICSAKVLIVIDDLDAPRPLEYLQGPFASGSIILITTRHEDLLDSIKVEARYKVKELSDAESHQLFRQYAFGDNNNTSDTLTELSEEILKRAGGLPLALKVFGSNLLNQSEEGWRWFIEKFKRVSIDDIDKKLLISFDALELVDPVLQNIFLDIACFFIGRKKKEVVNIMETCYAFVKRNIDILQKRCLLTINNSDELGMHDDELVLGMHDLLRDMGRKIARNNSPDEPGKHSRLWDLNDIHHVMKNHKGTEAIEGIIPIYFECNYIYKRDTFATKTFKRMSKLRFLYLDGVNLTGSFEQTLEDLRWLCWDWCPLKCLPSEFYPQKLVTLELRSSKLRSLWEQKHILIRLIQRSKNMVSPVFEKLKTLDMSYSRDLITTPDFTKTPCLETLNLKGCESLKEVHISIGSCVTLVSLYLSDCVKLRSLPDTICNLRSLEVFDIEHCTGLKVLPKELGNIQSLKKLNMKKLTVSILPDTICNLRSLEVLDIDQCYRLEALPIELGNIQSLKKLNMFGLRVSILPDSIGRLSKLVEMVLSYNYALKTLPDAICNLRSLEVFDIDGCMLKALPIDLGNIQFLKKLNMQSLTVSKLPDTICNLRSLEVLYIDWCSSLEALPIRLGNIQSLKELYMKGLSVSKLPDTICNLRSLEVLDIGQCYRLEALPIELGNIQSLKELKMFGSNVSKLPNSIGRLSKLVELRLSYNKKLETLPDTFRNLRSLEVLLLEGCSNLLSVPELPSSLKALYACDCTSMEKLPNLSNLKHLECLYLEKCSGVTEIRGLEKLISIREVRLVGCNSLAYTFTRRFFQIYSGFGHEIQIRINPPAQSPDWVTHNIGLQGVFLDLPPNVSHNFLATILYFKNYLSGYLRNTTSGFTWHFFYSGYGSIIDESMIIIVPRSEFPVRDGDNRIELRSSANILGIRLLYKTEIDEVDSNTVEERSYLLSTSGDKQFLGRLSF